MQALFQWTANFTGRIDFYICALSFGKNAVGERQRIGATLSVYQNGQFIWCARARCSQRACACLRCQLTRSLCMGATLCVYEKRPV